MTRTEAIKAAVTQALDAQHAELDHRDDLDMLVIKLPFRRGHLHPRAVLISAETETVLGKMR